MQTDMDSEQATWPLVGKPEKEDPDAPPRCDFCGELLTSPSAKERRKYCSRSCQSRASQGRIKARMAMPHSKRYTRTLKFSDPLYFN